MQAEDAQEPTVDPQVATLAAVFAGLSGEQREGLANALTGRA